jgi:alginate O-acetyltransferase complex protein AlgI
MVDAVFKAQPYQISSFQVWLAVLAYTLQIYFDFSGYSDMAIGLGKMFGFEFKRNFNFPYISQSIKEFWRRWHISLSNWFRDYLYIPLGGNKFGHFRTALNLLTVFTLCGLWHGAQFAFLFWGLYHGTFLALERGVFGRMLEKIPGVLRNIYVWLVVMVGWVFFRSEHFFVALHFIRKMAFMDNVYNPSADISSFMNKYFFTIMIIGMIFALKLPYKLYMYILKNGFASPLVMRNAGYVALFILFLVCIADVVSNNYNPFIYYRF